MKWLLMFSLCPFIPNPISADRLSRLEKKVAQNEEKLHELYEEVNILRERIDVIEEKINGAYDNNISSAEA